MNYLNVLCCECKDNCIYEWAEPEWICDPCEAAMRGVEIDEL